MNRKEIDLLLSRMEGLKSFLENKSLESLNHSMIKINRIFDLVWLIFFYFWCYKFAYSY